jgi:uncharacterized Tic20 family protein
MRKIERDGMSNGDHAYGPPPGYVQPPAGSVPPPGYVQPRPATGVVGWALGFIVFAPIPFLGAFASGIAMAIAYSATRNQGPLARANGRAAANWGLTFTLVSTALLVTHFILLFTFAGGEGVADFYPLGIPITLYGLIVLLQMVLAIVGTVRASRGKVTELPFAIPFFRR